MFGSKVLAVDRNNFVDWVDKLRMVHRTVKSEYILDEPFPITPAAHDLNTHAIKGYDESIVKTLMLACMNSELSEQFQNFRTFDMMKALNTRMHKTL
jgi:hypothetical protein